MSSKRRTHLAYRSFQDHSLAVRNRWIEALSAFDGVQLPVTFYRSESSGTVLANEDLDEAAGRIFASVTDWIDRIKKGEVHVRALTDEDLDDLMSALEDSYSPSEPEESLARVEEFTDSVLTLLKTMSCSVGSPE